MFSYALLMLGKPTFKMVEPQKGLMADYLGISRPSSSHSRSARERKKLAAGQQHQLAARISWIDTKWQSQLPGRALHYGENTSVGAA